MDLEIKILNISTITVAAITLFFAIFGQIFSSKHFKIVHFNLRILMFTLGFLWIILPLGTIILFWIMLTAEETPAKLSATFKFQIPKTFCAAICYAFRLVETAITFERLLATIYYKKYESHKKFRIYSGIAILLCLTIATIFSTVFNIFRISIFVNYGFLVTVETISFTLSYFLRKQNHKLRQMSNSQRQMLSSKYQLVENIKALNLLFPQARISFFLSNIALLISIPLREFYKEAYGFPLYVSIYNINVIVMSIYWMHKSEWMKEEMKNFRKSFRIHSSTEVEIMKATTVKTALGHFVKAHQTVDEHINNLKNVWK